MTWPTVMVLDSICVAAALSTCTVAPAEAIQLWIDGDTLGDFQRHLLNRVGAKSRRRHLHLIVPRLKRGNYIEACAIGNNTPFKPRSQRVYQHLRVRHYRSRWVRHQSRH